MTDERRERGEGTVECRGPGRWRFRSVDGQGGRFTSRAIYATREDALAALATFQEKILAGEIVPVKGMTLAMYYERRFLPRLERLVERGDRRAGTLGFYKSHWPRLEKVASLPLRSLTVATITRWADGLGDEVENPASYLAVLRAILQAAVSVDFLIESNPARAVRIERRKRDDEDRAPTPEEATALLGCEKIPREDRLIIAFALGAGLRPGEWRTLELADVHLDAPVPFVLVQFGAEGRVGTKTGKKRKVPLLSMAQNALRQWLAILPTYCPKNPRKLVFPTKRGRVRNREPFGRRKPHPGEQGTKPSRWHDFLRAAGIARTLTPHGLRHGCATGLLTGWLGEKLDPWAVQLLVGHDRLATTERYLHHGERDLFGAVRDQSPAGPGKKTAALGSALFSAGSESGAKGVPTGGLEPPKNARLAIVAPTQAENALSGLVRDRARELRRRIVAGDWPSEEEALAFAALVEAERREADAQLRAVRRVRSETWQSGLWDLLELVTELAVAHRRAE